MNLTPLGFGIIVAILLVVAVIVVVAENLRDRREDEPETRPYDEVSGCTIEGCPLVGVALMPSHTGYIWVCHQHAPGVAEWTGPAIFDQEDGVA